LIPERKTETTKETKVRENQRVENLTAVQGVYTRVSFVAKSGMKGLFHCQDAKLARQSDGNRNFEARKLISGDSSWVSLAHLASWRFKFLPIHADLLK
jgi:hypothetical protein